MGCASSTPMIQTTGSEMLKAATHVASDATKTAEDAVEDVKESVGISLETAKESVATAALSVKNEVENVVKEKTAQIDEAKNSIMEKLYLKSTNNGEHDDDDAKGKTTDINNMTTITDANNDDVHKTTGRVGNDDMEKTDINELKTQLNENVQNSNKTTATAMVMGNEGGVEEHIELTRTDTETDSLKTSTPEPEIEQALAKSKHNRMGKGNGDDDDDDEDDNPPTPKPTLAELENLAMEVLKQQPLELQHEKIINMAVNDILPVNTNDDSPLLTAQHDSFKTTTGIIDNNTTTNDMLKNIEIATTATSTSAKLNDNKTTATTATSIIDNMHKTAQMQTAVQHSLTNGHNHPPPLLPLTLATTDIAIATATTAQQQAKKQQPPLPPSAPTMESCKMVHQEVGTDKMKKSKHTKAQNKFRNEKVLAAKTHANYSETEQKRPRTTEWEKFADMLALQRKFNPHDAFRRNGTYTKFNAHGQLREKPSHMRLGMDDDSSDATYNFRSSPGNSQRSSARIEGRVQRLPNRPNTGNNRKNHHEASNVGSGGHYQFKNRRNSIKGGGRGGGRPVIGRKFDFNPNRSRVNNDVILSVSSDSISLENSLQPSTVNIPHTPYAPHLYESVKSHANTRSHHFRSDTRQLPPLEPLERISAQHKNRFQPDYDFDQQNIVYRNKTKHLTREYSQNSLFSNSSCEDANHHEDPHHSQSFKKSTTDLRLLPSTNPPVRNTSSFLATPRSSPFSIRKSYTDLYFSATNNNKENKPQTLGDKKLKVPKTLYNAGDKSACKVSKSSDLYCKKYSLK